MKIAYLLTPVEFGGAERVNLNFLKNVDRDKFQIYLVLFVRPWERENIFIQALESEKYPIHKIPVAIHPFSEGRDYLRILRCYKLMCSFLRKGAFDLLHSHGYFADIIGIPVARILRIPCISTCHGFISNNRKLRLFNTLNRIVLQFNNKIIVVSEEIKIGLVRIGIKESKIKVLENAVPEYSNEVYIDQKKKTIREMYGINEKEFVLGYVGRLSEEKGIKYLIEASAMLDKSDLPIKVLIVGEGPQRKELEDLAKKRGIEQKIIFAGFQNKVIDWLSALDVFILPSLTEGLPMAMLESMSCGVPVIASAVGGVPQVIASGKNGILVSPKKIDEMKDAICKIYNNNFLRESISSAAQDTIRLKFNIKEWTTKIEKEYLKVFDKT